MRAVVQRFDHKNSLFLIMPPLTLDVWYKFYKMWEKPIFYVKIDIHQLVLGMWLRLPEYRKYQADEWGISLRGHAKDLRRRMLAEFHGIVEDIDLEDLSEDGNLGVAYYQIADFTKSGMLYAHSSVSLAADPLGNSGTFVLVREPQIFETFHVDKTSAKGRGMNRRIDSEAKILEEIHHTIVTHCTDPKEITGELFLYIEKEPCISCDGVIQQFQAAHPHVKLSIYYEETMIKPRFSRGINMLKEPFRSHFYSDLTRENFEKLHGKATRLYQRYTANYNYTSEEAAFHTIEDLSRYLDDSVLNKLIMVGTIFNLAPDKQLHRYIANTLFEWKEIVDLEGQLERIAGLTESSIASTENPYLRSMEISYNEVKELART